MLRESIFMLAAAFAVITTFFMLIPVYNTFQNSLLPVAQTEVTDPVFASTLSYLPTNLYIIIQYSFVAVLIGLGIYLMLVPFRDEYTSRGGEWG